MSSINQSKSQQISNLLSNYQHIQPIYSIKDLKELKSIDNLHNHSESYLNSTVQKLLILTEQILPNHQLFISQKPYKKPNGKLVYLFSNNNTFNKILTEYGSEMLGANVIQILKTIYKDIFSEGESPAEDFQTLIEYVIDHKEELTQNDKNPRQIREMLESFSFIIKNNLSLRVRKSFTLNQLLHKLQYTNFHQLILDSLQSFSLSNDENYKIESKLRYLYKFLSICTKNGIIIYPARRTLDSKIKVDPFQIQEHFVVSVHTKQTRKSIFNNKVQQADSLDNIKTQQFSQIMFSFTKIPECLQVKLKSDFKMSGPFFVLFEQFYQSALTKYQCLYFEKPFESAFEQNLSRIRSQLGKKEPKISFSYKISLNSRQSIVIEFIKCVDMLIMMYLLFEELLIKLQDEQHNQRFMSHSSKAQRRYLQEQMSQNLYREAKGYLQKLTIFKRNIIYPHFR